MFPRFSIWKHIAKKIYILSLNSTRIAFFVKAALIGMRKYSKSRFCEEHLPKERIKKK